MTRSLLAACAALLATTPARSADPLPLWEIDTATEKLRPLEVSWVGFSPDGKNLVARVVFRGLTERLMAWDVKTRKNLFDVDLGEGVLRLGRQENAVTEAGTVLVPGGNQEVRLADGKAKAFTAKVLERSSAVWLKPGTGEAIWLCDNELEWTFAVGKLPPFDGDPKKADREPTLQRVTLAPPYARSPVCAVALSPDATRVVLAAKDYDGRDEDLRHPLVLYSLATGETPKLTLTAAVPSGHATAASVVRFSPDGKTIATGGWDCVVCLWDAAKAGKDWKSRAAIPCGQFTVSCLAFSPDNRTLAAGTFDTKGRPNLYLIDVQGGKLVSARRLERGMTALAYSPDGKLLVTGDGLGKVRVWDAAAVRGD